MRTAEWAARTAEWAARTAERAARTADWAVHRAGVCTADWAGVHTADWAGVRTADRAGVRTADRVGVRTADQVAAHSVEHTEVAANTVPRSRTDDREERTAEGAVHVVGEPCMRVGSVRRLAEAERRCKDHGLVLVRGRAEQDDGVGNQQGRELQGAVHREGVAHRGWG